MTLLYDYIMIKRWLTKFLKLEKADLSEQNMWIIAGLGNPGGKYENNRHNIGFMMIDKLVGFYNLQKAGQKFNAECFKGEIEGQKVLLLKPLTFMNESGQSIQPAKHFYKTDLDKIIVFHDELDIVAGKVKAKKGGGAAGHNGLKSIDSHVGKDYWRIRMGIGHPGEKHLVHSYVLHDFAKAEYKWLDVMLQSLAENIPLMLDNKADKAQIDKVMSKVNQDSLKTRQK